MTERVGDRFRSIREEMGEKQPEFAARLTATAKRIGVDARFDNTIVSKIELGRRELSIYEAAVVVATDPQRRGWDWLVLGETQPRRQREPRERRVG